jgi:Anti-sigma factor NepR
VLDVIGRIGAPPSLVIFTEGNHLMVLSSDDVVGAFPSWAKSRPQYANLDLTKSQDAVLISGSLQQHLQPIPFVEVRAEGQAILIGDFANEDGREGISSGPEVQRLIGEKLKAQYDLGEPIPDRLVELLKQLAQRVDERDDETG